MSPRSSLRRWWFFLVPLLLAAQVALGVHQLEHRLNPDLLAGDECAVCQFASTMAPAPEPMAIVPPAELFFAVLLPEAVQALRPAASPAGFNSRAPPAALSA